MASNSSSRRPSRNGNTAPSPRIEHFDGEVPPALSPLDAFALQGRLLAKQLDESQKGSRRMSRLPPSSVARSLSQPRPGYFRSPSSGESQRAPVSPGHQGYGTPRELEEPKYRPQSQHPRLSSMPKSAAGHDRDTDSDRQSLGGASYDGYGAPLADSPEEVSWFEDGDEGRIDTNKPSRPGVGPMSSRQNSSGGSPSRLNVMNTLAPPSSSSLRPTTSPGLNQQESSDDDYSNAGSTFSKPRKLSSSSGMSMPHSPMSQFVRPPPRSPSPCSEYANPSNPLPRPSFNFSRPLSRASTNLSISSPQIPGQEPTSEPQARTIYRENRPPPISVPEPPPEPSEDDVGELQTPGGQSYIYTKYSLPRGRTVSRDSLIFSGLQTPHFEWKEPLFESSPPPSAARTTRSARTPSPPPAPVQAASSSPMQAQKISPARTSPAKSVGQSDQTSPMPTRHSFDQTGPETLAVKTSVPTVRKIEDQRDTRSVSGDTSSTLRPNTSRSTGTVKSQMSSEDHVAKGIECHENGSLNESTYHLRIAAMQNNPTGMLLYALACRHGWGMRPNQREGLQWLRKAVDSAGLDITNYDSASIEPRGRNIQEQKARQAQFALSIYELGISHLNGWGIEQDKALALRCFEIAGHWGDVDALAEAGYCYVEGIGCKKDMKKAARLYRLAESKGMSMVGNSWIYKEKYMSDDKSVTTATTPTLRHRTTDGSEKKPRNKSRTRSIFARKKSVANSAHEDI